MQKLSNHQISAELIGAYLYQIPLNMPLKLARGTHDLRRGVLLKFATEQGEKWGEAAPLYGFSFESLEQVIAAARALQFEKNLNIQNLPPSLQFAFDMAQTAIPTVQSKLQQAQLVTQNSPFNLAEATTHCAKLKISPQTAQHDLQLINQLAKTTVQIRLDGNRQFSLRQALNFAAAIQNPAQIAFFEEPCATLEQTKIFAEQSGCKVALDESLTHFNGDFVAFPNIAALICKPTLIGSLRRCESMFEFACLHDLQFVISSCFESATGFDFLQNLAMFWAADTIHGLDTQKYLRHSEQKLELLWHR